MHALPLHAHACSHRTGQAKGQQAHGACAHGPAEARPGPHPACWLAHDSAVAPPANRASCGTLCTALAKHQCQPLFMQRVQLVVANVISLALPSPTRCNSGHRLALGKAPRPFAEQIHCHPPSLGARRPPSWMRCMGCAGVHAQQLPHTCSHTARMGWGPRTVLGRLAAAGVRLPRLEAHWVHPLLRACAPKPAPSPPTRAPPAPASSACRPPT